MKASKSSKLSLQAKVLLVLVLVIVPTAVLIAILKAHLARPLLEAEIRERGIGAGSTLRAEILNSEIELKNASQAETLEALIEDCLLRHPSIFRIDVIVPESSKLTRVVASNFEGPKIFNRTQYPIHEKMTWVLKVDDKGMRYWEIFLPIFNPIETGSEAAKLVGNIRLGISLKPTDTLVDTFWRIDAATFFLMSLIILTLLSFFLKRTFSSDKAYQLSTHQNLELTEQLQTLRQKLVTGEKLAAMGQLAANLAHEIGTPMNSIGGHLHLLKEELSELKKEHLGPSSQNTKTQEKVIDSCEKSENRLAIVEGQLFQIEKSIKQFLKTTEKPVVKTEIVQMEQVIERTLLLIQPHADVLDITISTEMDSPLGTVRVNPIDIEQVLLNLLNNSIDGIKEKRKLFPDIPSKIKVSARTIASSKTEWISVSVYDNGIGIAKGDLDKIKQPFFTTKAANEGTGLGLAICEELVKRAGGILSVESEEGQWTRVSFRIPLTVDK